MSTCGTGRGNRIIRPLQPQMNRQEPGNHVDDRARHEKRRNAPRAQFMQQLAVVLDIGQTANTRTQRHTDTLTVGVGHFQPGIAHSLKARGQAVLNE
ncbi:hypothetical protein D3C86_1767620 [compost metagenome]